MVSFLIVCPLEIEWQQVCKRLENAKTDPHLHLMAQSGKIGTYNVVCVKIKKGPKAQSDVRDALDFWKPRFVILAGVAGGLHDKKKKNNPDPFPNLGDVVLPKKVLCYEFGKYKKAGGFERLPDLDFSPDDILTTYASKLAESKDQSWTNRIQVHKPPAIKGGRRGKPRAGFVYIASGSKTIDNLESESVKEILSTIKPDVRAVEMEATEAYIAFRRELTVSQRNIGFFMIRGISDLPGQKTGGDKVRDEWKRYAADAAAAFMETLLIGNPNLDVDISKWEIFVDHMLDKALHTIKKRSKHPTIREALKHGFDLALEIKEANKPFPELPEGLTIKDIDTHAMFEASVGKYIALKRHIHVTDEDLTWLEKCYEIPGNYDEIYRKLEAKKILILAGEPGVGKTLTALRLLVALLEKGIQPRGVPLPEEREWRTQPEIEAKEVFYIDDPFGKSSPHTKELLESRLKVLEKFISDSVEKPAKTGYVIVTTRENVLNKSLDILNAPPHVRARLNDYVVRIASDDYKDLINTLINNYAEKFHCKWFKDDIMPIKAPSMSGVVPINVKHFCHDNKDRRASDDVLNMLNNCNNDPKDMRYSELLNSSEDERVYIIFSRFLQSTFIPEDEMEKLFVKVVADMRCKNWEPAKRWDAYYKERYSLWFKWSDSGWCRILHSSVREAIDEFFQHNKDVQSLVRRTFKILSNRAKNQDEYTRLAFAVGAPNVIGYLDRGLKDYAVYLSEKGGSEVQSALGQSVAANIGKARNGSGTSDMNIFEQILMYTVEHGVDSEVKGSVGSAVLDNGEGCGEKLQIVAANLSLPVQPPSVRRQIAWAIASNFALLIKPAQNALLNLLQKSEMDTWVKISAAEAIADNVEQAPKVLEKALLDLWNEGDPHINRSIIGALEYNLKDFSNNFKSHIINDALDKNEPAVIEWLIWAVMNNFEYLPKSLQKCLFKFAENRDPRVRKWVAEALIDNFEDFEDDYVELLMTLKEDPHAMVREAAIEKR